MKVNFFYESGEIEEIGTGHKYRSIEIANELQKRGHDTVFLSDERSDVLIIDHMDSKIDLIKEAKNNKIKVVLIDGDEKDIDYVDLSISAFTNTRSQYKGINYIVFPRDSYSIWNKYKTDSSKKSVFVSMGGYDINNLAELVLEVLDEMGLDAIVTKSINHGNLGEKFSRAEVFSEENYYNAMRECIIGVTNGGLTMFQSLFYGMPTIVVPQYEHQKINIDAVKHCCLSAETNKSDIKDKVNRVMGSEYLRTKLSIFSTQHVDGKGASRVAALIEGVCNE